MVLHKHNNMSKIELSCFSIYIISQPAMIDNKHRIKIEFTMSKIEGLQIQNEQTKQMESQT